MVKSSLIVGIFLFISFGSYAQGNANEREEYWGVIGNRAEKIVHAVVKDSLKREFAVAKLRDQYYLLNAAYELRDQKIADNSSLDLNELENETLRHTSLITQDFFSSLGNNLSVEEVEGIKNGITYGVYPNTVKAYKEMIPTLKDREIQVIDSLLHEARDYAIMAESSKKKHAWFGKYKGRINNFLSKEGYDLKKEGDKWEERLKSKEQ